MHYGLKKPFKKDNARILWEISAGVAIDFDFFFSVLLLTRFRFTTIPPPSIFPLSSLSRNYFLSPPGRPCSLSISPPDLSKRKYSWSSSPKPIFQEFFVSFRRGIWHNFFLLLLGCLIRRRRKWPTTSTQASVVHAQKPRAVHFFLPLLLWEENFFFIPSLLQPILSAFV